MPNFFESLLHRKPGGKKEIPQPIVEEDPSISDSERISRFFRQAGFSEDEMTWLDDFQTCQDCILSGELTPELARFMAQILPSRDWRYRFFRSLDRNNLLEVIKSLQALMQSLDTARDTKELVSDLRKTLDRTDASHTPIQKLSFAGEVVSYSALYHFFDHRPENLSTFIESGILPYNLHSIGDLLPYVRSIKSYPDQERLCVLMAKIDSRDTKGVNFIQSLALILENEDALILAEKYFDSDRNWAMRLEILADALTHACLGNVGNNEVDQALLGSYVRSQAKATGQPVAGVIAQVNRLSAREQFVLLNQYRSMLGNSGLQQLKMQLVEAPTHAKFKKIRQPQLKEQMTRAKRRESKRHPCVSLGIAKTAGYEIEYPAAQVQMAMGWERLGKIISMLGVKHGAGGRECDETSPGPFYDPATTLAVLRQYCDAGLLDFYRCTDMTCHLNLGLKSMKAMATLVRCLYLTAAAYDPDQSVYPKKEGDCVHRLNLVKNSQGLGDYIEAKAFDAVTQPGIEWNLNAAFYLSWAFGAYEDADKVISSATTPDTIKATGLHPYKKELALIGLTYVDTLKQGIAAIGLKGFLNLEVPYNLVMILDAQIKCVYPGIESRFDGPHQVEALPIIVGERHWPNIVAFAQNVTNETVAKIQKVEARIESDARSAIRQIETCSSDKERQQLLDQFISFFAVALPENPTQEEKWQAYAEVKSLFTLME